ncbi:MAG: L-rhamnose mutarotase [Acidobacteria bacterium]|nr:MAG: L-rhamnose mutarotase [Acidobacteriota bacterium]
MTRSVLTVDLKDDPAVIAAYKEHHRRVWPEVLSSLRAVGIRHMDIYILERRLVMIAETSDGLDIRRCFAAHVSSHPRVAEWETLMKSMQEPPPGSESGEWWAAMEPLFQLDGAQDASTAANTRDRRRTR